MADKCTMRVLRGLIILTLICILLSVAFAARAPLNDEGSVAATARIFVGGEKCAVVSVSEVLRDELISDEGTPSKVQQPEVAIADVMVAESHVNRRATNQFEVLAPRNRARVLSVRCTDAGTNV
ncbi:hypothetical protein R1sor_013245 [Riccia sorocarpa]|uniref:Uncharacterized protein n=1 Tax=Riccia sorocarpa TaxID=122646 RepID=A0ABD3HA15_9MARC